ncbi:hypothetical protein N310_12554, partial [Acanthisitta chloris]
AWVRLSLTSRSEESVTDLHEDDQQRIQEIKAELLLRARKSTQAKEPRFCGLEAASDYSNNQEQGTECFKSPRFPPDRHTQALRTQEILGSRSQQAVPFYRADPSDCCLLEDMQLRSWSAPHMPVCNQLPTPATGNPSAMAELDPLLQKESDTCAMSSAAMSHIQSEFHFPAPKLLSVKKSSEDLAKQITSITFSSRKLLQPPLSSTALGSSLHRDGSGGITPLEVESPGSEEESHDRQRWERSK